MQKKAIVIGATSGIGRELAKILAREGYILGLVGRRMPLLEQLKQELPSEVFIRQIDVAAETAIDQLKELIREMDGVDLGIISSGVGFINPNLRWQRERETIAVNIAGFAAMANVLMHHFLTRGAGHLVGISSIAGLRGDSSAPAYAASKAFISNYLQGLRKKTVKMRTGVVITEVQPGFVDTAMAQGEGLFWVAPPEKAARQIYRAIKKRKKHVYITQRWRVIAWFMKILPDFIYNRI
ncbi:MAG: oxidoreductase [Nitrospirae bacterium GWD2_57_9]|nr:MAG: oxidoreductase [Nitrospirae bacterium GWD2_57_9]OGW51016.1 MAG: oxidoreductase [Nitrospirae bacterium GWC2_57_9]